MDLLSLSMAGMGVSILAIIKYLYHEIPSVFIGGGDR